MEEIELNADTKLRATRIVKKAMEKYNLDFGQEKAHVFVHSLILEEFPELDTKKIRTRPIVFMIYILLGTDYALFTSWKEVYEDFMLMPGDDKFHVVEENNTTTCVCGQSDLTHSLVIQSKSTGIELELGSVCIEKHYISKLKKREQEKYKDILRKQKTKMRNLKFDRKNPGVRGEKKRKRQERYDRQHKEYIERLEAERKQYQYEKGEEERKRAERAERDQKDRAAEQHQYKHIEYKRPPIAPPITRPPRPPPGPKTTFSTIVHHKVDHDELIKNLDKQKREKERKEKEEWSKTNGIRKFFN